MNNAKLISYICSALGTKQKLESKGRKHAGKKYMKNKSTTNAKMYAGLEKKEKKDPKHKKVSQNPKDTDETDSSLSPRHKCSFYSKFHKKSLEFC